MLKLSLLQALVCLTAVVLSTSSVNADFTISFSDGDLTVNPVFNEVETFSFDIVIAGDFGPGLYTNPEIVSVDYNVFGGLPIATPSGFSNFNLDRVDVDNTEFYGQGSSLNFEIASGSDLTDGLQVADLVGGGGDPVFVFHAHENGTGRFHPPLFELFADGTGRIQNSDNNGIDFGEEYITDVAFDPSSLTLSTATFAVPEPGSSGILIAGLGMFFGRRRRS